MKPANDDLWIYRGDTLKRSYKLREKDTGTPIDITGWVFLAQVRKDADDDTVLLAPTVTIVDGANGVFRLDASSAETEGLTQGRNVWDLQSTNAAGEVRTWVAGKAMVISDVSR